MSALGEVHIPARHSTLTVALPDGTPGKCKLVVLFDPGSGQYLWRHFMESAPDVAPEEAYQGLLKRTSRNSAIYVSADRIAWFWLAGGDLSIQQSSGPVRSMDEAYDRALADLRAHWLDYYNWKLYVFHHVIVGELVDSSFVVDPQSTSAMPFGFVWIDEVRRAGDDWAITLHARWKAVLTLDSAFQPKGMRRVEK